MSSEDFNKRFCVINCENSLRWSPISFPDMFQQHLSKDGDIWQSVNIANGECLPDDIDNFHGIVLTGSRFNCRDKDTLPWFEGLSNLIIKASNRGKPNIYGGCFGCQIIAFALGGCVGFNPFNKFILQAENIVPISTEFSKYFDHSDTDDKHEYFNIIVSHGDCILELPKDATRLASSSTCVNEIFVSGLNNNLLGVQGHPEFDLDYAIKERIWPSVVDLKKRLSEEEAKYSLGTFENFTRTDSDKLCSLISSFLRK